MKTRKGGEQMNSSKLKGIRVEKGKTQKNIAELIGKSLVTYSKKERGEVEFSNEEMGCTTERDRRYIRMVFSVYADPHTKLRRYVQERVVETLGGAAVRPA